MARAVALARTAARAAARAAAQAGQPHGLPEQRDVFSCVVYVCAFSYILCHGRVPASGDVSDANQVNWRQLMALLPK